MENKELLGFISSAIMGGAMYDGVKVVLGSHYNELKEYLESDNQKEFETILNYLIKSDKELKRKIESLQRGEDKNIVENVANGNKKADIKIESKSSMSMKDVGNDNTDSNIKISL